jgi:hypothetical protein
VLGSLTRRRFPVVVMLAIAGVIGSWLPAVQASAATSATVSSSVIPFATTNGDVIALLDITVAGQPVVAIGGDFTQITTTDGVKHAATNFAAVNELTGALVYAATDVSSTGYVRALAYQNGLLYIGGDFTSFSDVTRSHILALNLPSWDVASWNPGASGSIAAIAVDSSAVYFSGATGALKAVSLSTGGTIWSDPVVNGGVRDLLINPSTDGLYVAGFFDSVGGFTNHGLIEVNKTTGKPITTFAPVLQPNSGTGCCPTWDGEDPIAIALDTNVSPAVLVMASGGHWNYSRLLNSTTGANIWDHFLSGDGQAVAVIGDSVLVGYHRNRNNTGSFDWPYYAAQLQTSNGSMQSWQAGISTAPGQVTDGDNNGVRSFAYDPTTGILVVGGAFTRYGASCDPAVTTVCTGGTKLNSLAAYTVTGVSTPKPAAPAKPTVTSSSATTADVSWTAVSGASTYQVQRSAAGENTFSTVGSKVVGLTYHDTGLTPGASYDYRVLATNVGGTSSPSPTATAMTVPGQPGTLTASANGTSEIDLSWGAATGATSYDVQRGSAGSYSFGTDLGTVTGLTFADTGLTPGTAYDYRVVPSDAAGAGAPSNAATATTEPQQGSGQTELRALAGSGRYLVYGQFAELLNKHPAATGTLYYRTLHGTPQAIAVINQPGVAYLSGAMLVYASSANVTNNKMSWRNLATGAHGTMSAAPAHPASSGASGSTNTVVAAAPNGWIIEQHFAGDTGQPDVLYLRTTSGTMTKLGAPEPDGTPFTLRESNTTLVAYSASSASSNGAAVLMRFANPGVFHQFVPTNPRARTSCPSVTAKYIACSYVGSHGAQRMRLYTTTGTLAVATGKHCPTGRATVLGHSLAWVTLSGQQCPKHRLVIVNRHGKLRVAAGHYDVNPISAFGGIIVPAHRVGSGMDRELDYFTKASHKQVLVKE